MKCPLCSNTSITEYHSDKYRTYLQCLECRLVFVPENYHLTPGEEKAVYDLHQNDPSDEGYRNFLSRLTEPLAERLAPGAEGLDFGCGSGPALSKIMEETGFRMSLYDPFYFNNTEMLKQRWDFITATEVVEHLASPGFELCRLFKLLKDKGTLGMMTKMVIDREAFSRWHYIQDPAHICFYSKASFEYLAEKFNTELEFIGKDVIVMRKQ